MAADDACGGLRTAYSLKALRRSLMHGQPQKPYERFLQKRKNYKQKIRLWGGSGGDCFAFDSGAGSSASAVLSFFRGGLLYIIFLKSRYVSA